MIKLSGFSNISGLSRIEARRIQRQIERRRSNKIIANDNGPPPQPEPPAPAAPRPVAPAAAKALDKFYTRPHVAAFCTAVLKALVPNDAVFIEPSAGAGAFIDAVATTGSKIVGLDIEPERADIVQHDFLKRGIFKKLALKPADRRNLVVIGNPPFGVRSSLVTQFINRALDMGDTVGFIVGIGMGYHRAQAMVRPDARLIVDVELPKYGYTFDGKPYGVVTRFQVWTIRPPQEGEYVYTGDITKGGKPRIKCRVADNLRRNAPDSLECDDLRLNRFRGGRGRSLPAFDLAIPFMKARDYRQQVTTDPAKLNLDFEYWLVTAKADRETVLSRLMQIDFKEIATRHNHRGQRFVGVDFVEAYQRIADANVVAANDSTHSVEGAEPLKLAA